MLRTSLLLSCALGVASVARADGMLDPAFGSGGRVTTNFTNSDPDEAEAVAVLPNGGMIAAGLTEINLEQSVMAVARYLPNGGLDFSFDGDGRVHVYFETQPDFRGSVRQVLLQPNGRILLVGYLRFGGLYHALARLDANGALDTSFGTGGKVTTLLAGGWDAGVAAQLQSDGRIVVLGATGSFALPGVVLARYNVDGSLDPSFGTGGQVAVPLTLGLRAASLAIQPDGKILVGGTLTIGAGDFAVIRLLPDGALDTSFGSDGLATWDFGAGESGRALLLLGDGRIVVAGHRTAPTLTFALVRFLANGALDTSFGTGGLAMAVGGSGEVATDALLQPNGKILVGGYTSELATRDFILGRFHAEGAFDTTFGASGFLRTDFGGSWDLVSAVALAGPDRVVAAGTVRNGGDPDFGLARYIAATPVEVLTFSVE